MPRLTLPYVSLTIPVGVSRAPPAFPPVLAARWAGRLGMRIVAMNRRAVGALVFTAALMVLSLLALVSSFWVVALPAELPKTPVAQVPDSPVETLTVFPPEL